MFLELERTLSLVANSSRDVDEMPQFVSILNGNVLEPLTEAGKNCISPLPPLPPPPCVGKPPLPCVGKPPPPCYGAPPCVGIPPCFNTCYGG